jgi:hypothetical protein
MMIFQKPILGALTLCALSASSISAQADVTVTMHMSMDAPFMHANGGAAAPQVSAMMDKLGGSTIYMSGHKMRYDSALISVISDMAAHKMWMVNPNTHQYAEMPFNSSQMMPQNSMAGSMPNMNNVKVIDTGKSTKVLGHTAHHYIEKVTTNIHGEPANISIDILAATDLPAMPGSAGNKIHGFPLVTVTKMSGGGPMPGGMTMKQAATSISTRSIPASEFEVPAGYTRTTYKEITSGMMSGMMGGMGSMGH